MTIELTGEQQKVIDLAVSSGIYRNPGEVLAAALALLSEDIVDGAVSESRTDEPRFRLADIEAELRALGKIK